MLFEIFRANSDERRGKPCDSDAMVSGPECGCADVVSSSRFVSMIGKPKQAPNSLPYPSGLRLSPRLSPTGISTLTALSPYPHISTVPSGKTPTMLVILPVSTFSVLPSASPLALFWQRFHRFDDLGLRGQTNQTVEIVKPSRGHLKEQNLFLLDSDL